MDTTTKEKVIARRATDPHVPAATLARELGVSRERIRQILVSLGLPTRSVRRIGTKDTGYSLRYGRRLTSHVVGAAAELLVCADLLGRGWNVYRAVSHHAPCDIVAWHEDHIIRIEVRCGRLHSSGRVRYVMPTDRVYDHLALSLDGGRVKYVPDIPHIETA